MAKAQYDRETVVSSAIDIFWTKGFKGASMQQVMSATGLQAGSIYYSFGNKKALFKEALEGYARHSMERIKNTMESSPSIGEGICSNLEWFIREASKENYRSCFLVKTQLEMTDEDRELRNLASTKLQDIEGVFREYLEKETSAELAQARAASIMLHIFGLRVYGYRPESRNTMRQALQAGLPWLPWPAETENES